MRLLTRTTLYFLIAMVLLLAAAGIFLFSRFSNEIDHKTDEELVIDEIQWIRYLESVSDNGTAFILRTPELLIFPADEPVTTYPRIRETFGFSARQNKEVPYRQLSHVVSISGTPYQIVIRKSQEQKTVLLSNITRIMVLVFAGMFLVTLLLNWVISQTIWRPFKKSLEKIRGAELQKMEAIHFEKTNVKEFNELNASLNYMTDRIYNDYVNMKEFTENAAHEMQTPLAVVQSKLELLLQDVNLTDGQVSAIAQAGSALKRLSNLNQSLLLLARIENNQYEAGDNISLTGITQKYLQLFDEIIKDKKVTIETFFDDDFLVPVHPLLADSLVSNLVGNAVKYNYPGGKLTISVYKHKYLISNTSHLPPINSKQLFKRFHGKQNGEDTSNGLGLAIVKKIADTHRLNISYHANEGVHHFTIEKQDEAK